MFMGKSVLAMVPARAGSKGIPDKNIRPLAGVPLIGHAGQCLADLDWLDQRVISTDSQEYADVGAAYGLDAPHLRPADLAGDRASVGDAARHVLREAEAHYDKRFDLLVLAEPSSPLRQPRDITETVETLITSGAETAFTVSPLDAHFHPDKALSVDADGRLSFATQGGTTITARQQLSSLWIRNGFCYAATRACILDKAAFVTDHTVAVKIDRPFANIDSPLDFDWAEFLLARQT
jgi:CMP-N-acetylneuraminic acid synthetase